MSRPLAGTTVASLKKAATDLAASPIFSTEERRVWSHLAVFIDDISAGKGDMGIEDFLFAMTDERIAKKNAEFHDRSERAAVASMQDVVMKLASGEAVPDLKLEDWLRRVYISNEAEMAGDHKRQFTGQLFPRIDAVTRDSTDAEKVKKDTLDFAAEQVARVEKFFRKIEGLPQDLRDNVARNMSAIKAQMEEIGKAALTPDSVVAEMARLKEVSQALIHVGDAVKFASRLSVLAPDSESYKKEFDSATASLGAATAIARPNPAVVEVPAPANPRLGMSIADRFAADKASMMRESSEYLGAHRNGPGDHAEFDPKTLAPEHRARAGALTTQAVEAGRAGNFDVALERISDAMKALEATREAKSGIYLQEIPVEGGVPILVRDARKGDNPPARGTESFEMQYLNMIRAAMDIAVIEGRPEIRQQLLERAATFMETFHQQGDLPRDVDGRIAGERKFAKALDREVAGITGLMEEAGIPNALNKLSVAKDFQNLNTQHFNIVTISEVAGRPVIEAEIAMKGLTAEQKAEYDAIRNPNPAERPGWYNALPWWQQELVQKYAQTIQAGEHTISTQLWQLVGMKNAFEKVTAVFDPAKSEVEVVHTSKHAGTLASISEDEHDRGRIAELNTRQAQAWVGEDTKLHVNSFNTAGALGRSHDIEITEQLGAAAVTVGGRYTNTAFNLGRGSGGSSILEGINTTIAGVSDALAANTAPNPKAAAAMRVVQVQLEPRPAGLFGGLRRFLSHPIDSLRSADKAIATLVESGVVDAKGAAVLSSAIALRGDADKVGATSRILSVGNASLMASTALSQLTSLITRSGEMRGLAGLPKEETIGMCASGKDRTGLAMHDQSAQAVAKKLEVPVVAVDAALVAAGHTAQQAGGVYSCGSAAGCFGTRYDNGWGMGNVGIAMVRGAIVKNIAGNRQGREGQLVGLIEYTSHGTSDKLNVVSHSEMLKHPERHTDITPGGHPAETEHQAEVAARKAALSHARDGALVDSVARLQEVTKGLEASAASVIPAAASVEARVETAAVSTPAKAQEEVKATVVPSTPARPQEPAKTTRPDLAALPGMDDVLSKLKATTATIQRTASGASSESLDGPEAEQKHVENPTKGRVKSQVEEIEARRKVAFPPTTSRTTPVGGASR